MKLKMDNKKNIVFSFNILGKGFTVFKKEPTPKPQKQKQKKKPREFRYF